VITLPGAYRIPPPAPSWDGLPPQDGPRPADQDGDSDPAGDAGPSAQDNEPRAQLCPRCGALGTHYLTCTSLQLPAGYRFGRDAGPGGPCDEAVVRGPVRA
jgi:hypothetical protein